MSTSVKLSEEDKEKLDRLQALVTLRAGGKVTQQEILSALIGEALARGDEFLGKAFKPNIPMPDEGFKRMLSLTEDWGVETCWKEVDELLYGAAKRGRR